MRLTSWTSAPLPPRVEWFEILREVVAVMDPSTPAEARARPLFAASHLHCQRGGRSRTGEECLACRRLVSILPSRAERTVTVRCLWTDQERVADVMTLARRAASVDRDASLAEAAAIARREGVHDLLVTDDDDVIGVICACSLVRGQAAVGERMIPHVWTVPATATLGQAAEAMYRLEVSLLVVADHGVVSGTISAADLRVEVSPHVH
jgi:signal-transduction protein with cAMP-binding, CBS, and nucleotidyltransferase domain